MNEISPSKPTKPSEWNHVCTWGDGRCKNPVGRFDDGNRSGWCIFHRRHGSGPQSATIAEESLIHDRESYVRSAMLEVYGSGADNTNVAATRALLRPMKVEPINFKIPSP